MGIKVALLSFLVLAVAGSGWWYATSGLEFQSFIFAKYSKLFLPDIRPANTTKALEISRNVLQLVSTIQPGNVNSVMFDLGDGLSVSLFLPMDDTKEFALAAAEAPVLLWFHGGGFVEGSVAVEQKNTQKIANMTGYLVVSVDYRLAPEHEFPSAVQDGTRALHWLFQNIHSFGGDKNKVVVGGESAGGNLAASTIIGHITEEGPEGQIIGYLGVYPCLDHGSYTESHFTHRHTSGFLTLAQMQWYWALYLGKDQSIKAQDIRACPARAPDHILRQFPKTFMVLAEHDILLDEGVNFIHRLKDNHVEADFYTYQGTIHGFFGRRMFGSSGPDSLLRACDQLLKMLPHSRYISKGKAPSASSSEMTERVVHSDGF